MATRACNECAFGTPSDVHCTTITCVNTVEAPGQLRQVDPGGTCRRFRAKRQPVLRLDPPVPPNDQIRYIALTKGKFAIVDAADYAWLSRYKWCLSRSSPGCFYAGRAGRGRLLLMHRVIMNPPNGLVVDHIDGNGLNNCRSNLRLCTQAQNVRNTRGRKTGSKYKGVLRVGRHQFQARIKINGHTQKIGPFGNEIEAALAYDLRALTLFGQFAYLNFPHIAEATSQAGKLAVMAS